VRIGVIGGGITGLTAAYELAKNGHDVEIFEATDAIGGIAGAVPIDGFHLEKYYHHFFKSDVHVLELLQELGLEERLLWKQSRMGYYSGNKAYDFGTPRSLLKFKPLSLMDKLMFGVSVLKLMTTKDWKALENVTARDWLVSSAGEKAFRTVWKPLLVSKFGEEYDKVSMAWMWGKIRLRGTSKESGKEMLGYIDGSSSVLFDRLRSVLADKGVKINLNCRVESIKKAGETFSLETKISSGDHWSSESNNLVFDRIITAIPLPVFGKLAAGAPCRLPKYTG
jgi:protoporphyrinogen oxidase